jgi:hypothetical protein
VPKKIDHTPIGQEIDPLRHPDHRRPVTRREFLAQGFITGAATVAAPTLYSLFGRSHEALAQAVCSPPVGGAGMIPFMCFDLGGGANIAGSNVLAGGPGGQMDLLSEGGYSKLGLPSEFMPGQSTPDDQINSELGLLFHSDSAMLQGILSKTSVTTRAQINGAIFCSRSLNDTENNELNPLYGIAKVGSDGGLLTLIGSRSSISGGKSLPPAYLVDPALRPTKVSRASDATGLVDAGRMADFLDAYGSARVVEAIERISHRKVDTIQALGEQEVASQILRSAYSDSTQLVQVYSDPDSLNPESDPVITGQLDSIFSADEMNQSTFEKTAAAMKLTVEQHVGAACVELGGYDYHDSTRTTGERRDLAAGQAIGAALEYAARCCNDLVVYVFSDGSVASNGQTDAGANGKGIWKGDNSSTAASFMLVYRKDAAAGRPVLVNDAAQLAGVRQQLGFFGSDGSVDRNAMEFSNNPAKLAETAVLNYLALHGLDDQFTSLLPEGTLGQVTPRDDMVAFEPIR